MFGWKFVKFEPNHYVVVTKKGRAVRRGRGLSFWFYAPSTSIVKVPLESRSVPFLFEELTRDFQTATVQGDLVYRIADAEKLADQANYAVDARTLQYLSDDPDRIDQRLVNVAKAAARKAVSALDLREAIRCFEKVAGAIGEAVRGDAYLEGLGIEATNVSVLSILPNKETARALEAETREGILREADDAVYARRNSAVEQERRIRENELATEVAVEEKKRQIQETQVDAQRSIKEKERVIEAEELAFRVEQEQENAKLVELSAKNRRAEADVKAYALAAVLEPLAKADPEVIRALANVGLDSDRLIANAFAGLAQNADKIGELNVSPDLLQRLLKK